MYLCSYSVATTLLLHGWLLGARHYMLHVHVMAALHCTIYYNVHVHCREYMNLAVDTVLNATCTVVATCTCACKNI